MRKKLATRKENAEYIYKNLFKLYGTNFLSWVCLAFLTLTHTHTHERWLDCLGRGGFDWIMKINGRTATTCTLYTQTKSWWTSVETETRNEPNRNPNWNRNGHEAAEWRGKRALYRFDFVLFWYIYSLSFFVFVGWKGKCVSFIALSVTFQFL